jgi:hypothetical protein
MQNIILEANTTVPSCGAAVSRSDDSMVFAIPCLCADVVFYLCVPRLQATVLSSILLDTRIASVSKLGTGVVFFFLFDQKSVLFFKIRVFFCLYENKIVRSAVSGYPQEKSKKFL